METREKTPDWIDQTIYGVGVAICIVIDALVDAWRWLECPAPDRPRQEQELPWLSDKVIWAFAILAIAVTLISLGYAHFGIPAST